MPVGVEDEHRAYPRRRGSDDHRDLQREIDLLSATVFGVKGQGGVLRSLDSMRRQMRRNTQAVVLSTLTMASAMIGLAVVIAQHG